ncbi:MAG: protein-glutamate O-methyltransferase CheR [Hyphomonadaceae bacterium]|nr:protein-glutamate O-methyltransferase CheR [Hyphomonadaceae bacterium]
MNDLDFAHFCALMLQRSGLVLTPDKAYLVRSRIDPLAIQCGMADAAAVLQAIRLRPDERLIRRCVDAMATHESYFFRDGTPFEQLKTRLLGPLIAARAPRRALRIWSCACSSGQEAYSVAMLLKEWGPALDGWRIEIVATDMSEPILEKARTGLYTQFEVQRGLSTERLLRWFGKSGDQWQVSPAIRDMVTFRRHNLMDGVSGMGQFDLVFCRNVLIYFDRPKKAEILNALAGAMAPDAALFLGSAETVIGLTQALEPAPDLRGVYRIAAARASLAAAV